MNFRSSTWYLDDAKFSLDRPCNDKDKTTLEILVSRGYDRRIEMIRYAQSSQSHPGIGQVPLMRGTIHPMSQLPQILSCDVHERSMVPSYLM